MRAVECDVCGEAVKWNRARVSIEVYLHTAAEERTSWEEIEVCDDCLKLPMLEVLKRGCGEFDESHSEAGGAED